MRGFSLFLICTLVIARVAFAHKDARSPYAWQSEKNPEKAEKLRNEEVPTCNFSLPRCSPAQ